MVPERANAANALRLWSRFPVDDHPRPLVLTGSTVHMGGGFDSDQAKVSFHEGSVESAVAMPAGVLEAIRPVPVPRRQVSDVLTVTAVRRVTAEFPTDRGLRRLDAWAVTMTHAIEPIMVLDPKVAASAWHPSELRRDAGAGAAVRAELHLDDRTITYTFIGTPRAYADYPRVEVMESHTAAMIQPILVDRGGSGLRRAYAESRQVTATLRRPLGARVLITPSGYPVPVTTPGRT